MAESHDYPFLSRNAFEELLDKFPANRLIGDVKLSLHVKILTFVLEFYKNLQIPKLEMRKNVTGQKKKPICFT